MKDDEIKLLLTLAPAQDVQGIRRNGPSLATDAVPGMHSKRCNFILLKWTDRGWWDYGVSARTGWLTKRGLEVANEVARKMGQPLTQGD